MSAKANKKEVREVSTQVNGGTAIMSFPASWLDARPEGETLESLIVAAYNAEGINVPVRIIYEIKVSGLDTPEFTWATFEWQCGDESGDMGIALDCKDTMGFDYFGVCENDQIKWLEDLADKAMSIGKGWPSRSDVRKAFGKMDKVIRSECEIDLDELIDLLDIEIDEDD